MSFTPTLLQQGQESNQSHRQFGTMAVAFSFITLYDYDARLGVFIVAPLILE